MNQHEGAGKWETIDVVRRGDVVVITLNRPERLNAWNRPMARELTEAIEAANRDLTTGAIVLTGNGRAFCAGADMHMLADRQARRAAGDPEPVGHGGMPEGSDWVSLCRKSKPLVAAVNGITIGVGLTMVLSFDVILASERARFGIGLTKVGLLPELGASHFLVQRMGFGQASLFCLTADMWSAEEAWQAGLVDRVLPADRLLDGAVDLATRIAANPRPQLHLLKELLTLNGSETDLELVQTREDHLNRTYCVTSPEHREAVAAFREKRTPLFAPRSPDRGAFARTETQ